MGINASSSLISRPKSKHGARGKRSGGWRVGRRLSGLLVALLAQFVPGLVRMVYALDASALPVGGSVRVGAGTISQNGNLLMVHQSTPQLGLDWQSFNIGSGSTVRFVQPGTTSVALNRVVGNDPSQIFGQLQSNGQVFLTNPNGVLFAPGARADVGGLVASTLDLSQSDFANGNYIFTSRNSANGTGGLTKAGVVNQGTLQAATGGYIALLGSNVSNQGQIDAPLGSVVLAAGQAVTVGLDSSGLLSATVTPGSSAALLVSNSGNISADGGRVRLDARSAQGIAESLVNNSGTIRAQTVQNINGEIWLGGATEVDNSGTLDVSAGKAANSDSSAGQIAIKADMQSGTANVGGKLLAQGGLQGGNGGSIETSGAHAHFASTLVVDTQAASGKAGQWLIDPNDFVIAASGGDITGAALSSNLASASVTINSTSGAIVTSAGLSLIHI